MATSRSCGIAFLAAGMTILSHVSLATPDLSVMVPMRDGVRLSTDVYLPDSLAARPAVLLRTPYNKETDFVDPDWIDEILSHEYVYVIQDTRGRFASEGADSTFWTDGWGVNQDGYDTIEWIAAQPWCDGNVGMYGESARGILQYLAAGAAPPHLKACIVRIACEDFYHKAFFQGGEFRKELVQNWFDSQGSLDMLPFFLDHPTREAFWDTLDLATRASEVTVPILHIGGHYDVFGESAIDAFNLLQYQGGIGAEGRQKLVLGPWTHWNINETIQGELEYPESVIYDLEVLRWRWFDRWLKGVQNWVDAEPPVSYYLMGDPEDSTSSGNIWKESVTFPPQVINFPFFLHAYQSSTPFSLQTIPPPSWSDAFYYSFDPKVPLETRGGRNLYLEYGPYDQRPVHTGRSDVILLATDPLVGPVIVVGKPRLTFWAQVTTPDTDWTAKLIDGYPDGREMLVTDGILRARFRNGFETEELMEPGNWYRFEIDLWSTAITFNEGHRIMLAISNSNYTRFEINPNTGGPFGDTSDPILAEIAILAEYDHPSHLTLPIAFGSTLDLPEDFLSAAEPFRIMLRQNPAPRFTIDVEGHLIDPVVCDVHGVDGRLLRHFQLPPSAASGARFTWDGRDRSDRPVASGVYFLNLVDGMGRRSTTRLVLTR